jgi:hypothetical protein
VKLAKRRKTLLEHPIEKEKRREEREEERKKKGRE